MLICALWTFRLSLPCCRFFRPIYQSGVSCHSSRQISGSILRHRVWNQGKAVVPRVLVNSAPAYFQLYCKYYFKSRFATTLLTTSYDYSKCRKFHSLLTRRISLEKIKALPRSLSALPFKLKGNCYLIKPPPPAGPPGPAPGWRGEALL